jgi:hypothetical protein
MCAPEKFEMKDAYNCSTKGVICLTYCTHGEKQYVGQTGSWKTEWKNTSLICIRKKNTAGIHYSLPGDSHSNFKVQIVEKVRPNTPTL